MVDEQHEGARADRDQNIVDLDAPKLILHAETARPAGFC